MRISLKTKVGTHYKAVWDGFNKVLFADTFPAVVNTELELYEGNKIGHQKKGFSSLLFKKFNWVSTVKDTTYNANGFAYTTNVDGVLQEVSMKHAINKYGGNSIIHDTLEYHSGSVLLDYMLAVPLKTWLYFRKSVYKKHFGEPALITTITRDEYGWKSQYQQSNHHHQICEVQF